MIFTWRRNLILLSILLSGGCDHPAEIAPPDFPSFGKQLQLVRTGEADQIVLTTEINQDELRNLGELTSLRVLCLENGYVTDEGVAHLRGLSNLEQLKLWKSPLGDAGIEALAGLTNLRLFNVPDAQFTDQALNLLAQLPQLELLRIGSPNITDAGIDSLQAMPNLRFLHLINIPITDAALIKIARLKQLESLYLDHTQVSDDGIEQLLQSRPDLHFHINQLHHEDDPQHHEHPQQK